ncbi:ATPase components of ABC transporters with duplicated ATPase domains [Lachnospiraceae bacterium KM106-2]|nr:ATPase components of ABC transporters with duplicated ATPase domains [Lachnospiraceae bacterium KM106-2]
MNLLTVQQVTKSYTERILFDNISLGINQGDKIGVIGINGTGKSTLLKIIAGLIDPDEGEIVKGNKVHVEYLAQNPEFDSKKTLLQNVISGKHDENEQWGIESEAKSMLNKVGISDYDADPSTLSGGQRKRAALIRTLLTPADILILDEPTNHLDNEMAEWLEKYLNNYKGSLIMVTHDRYFLDKVTNKIVEIDKGKLYTYEANYSGFLELKAQREEIEVATERKNKSLYRMELEWMKRGARARSTKQKARIERFEDLSNRKQIETDGSVEMSSLSSRLGKKTIEVNGISKAYGPKVLIDDFTYIFLKNDRIGIIGHNGCGKSTLLKIINGIIEPDQGTVEIGQTVKIGYFSQENEYLDERLRVIDYVKETAEYIQTKDGTVSASQMCEKFLFDSSMQYTQIARLSGGEKRRLYLLKVLMEAPNVLILDEPTNDLDIRTLSILESYLDGFDGIVITVSHDRYFLDRIVERIFAFEGNGVIRQYEGNYTDYRSVSAEASTEKQEIASEKTEKPKYKKEKDVKLKFTYNEQKEYNEIDSVIAKLESELETIEDGIAKSATDFVKLNEFMEKKAKTEKELEEKMDRWVYLNDLAEKMEEAKKNKDK